MCDFAGHAEAGIGRSCGAVAPPQAVSRFYCPEIGFTPAWYQQFYFFSNLAMGHEDNRWRGIRLGPDDSLWIREAHQMT